MSCGTAAFAQQKEGVDFGGYNVRQSVELGWRFVDVNGSQPTYNTFVDLHNGPRLLGQTLEMRSLGHNGLLFDTLSYDGFGYGGDPNTAARYRIEKQRWYRLSGSFRRNRNFWNYDLFANPLNPPTSNPSIPVRTSPHSFDMVRRMGDASLTLLPDSRVSVRLGYDRNVSEGPATTTFHPTDVPSAEFLLFLPWLTKQETFRAGLDLKLLPRTNVSFDQTFERLRDGLSSSDKTFAFQLPNGVPYDLGLAFNTVAFQPCDRPVTNPATSPPTASPNCVGASQFSRSETYHATYPTEQLSLQSNYWRNVEVAGRFAYSTAQMRMPSFVDAFTGILPSTLQQSFTDHAAARARRTAVNGELALTWAATEALQITDIARYTKFRIPGLEDFAETSLFAASAIATPNTLATCTAPFTASKCPIHNGNSPADIANDVLGSLLAQTLASNQVEARYDFRRAGARFGYRFEQRHIDEFTSVLASEIFDPLLPNRGDCAGVKLQPDGTCQVTASTTPTAGSFLIHEHAAIGGIWANPVPALRLNVDGELASADNAFTRIDPRRSDEVRARASFHPRPWLELSASGNRRDASNGAINVEAAQHHRGYGFAAVLAQPKSAFAFQASYDYLRDDSHATICYVLAQTPAAAPRCPGLNGYVRGISNYDEAVRFGNLGLRWQPGKRVSATLGYNVSRSSGSVLLINPIASPGSLDAMWHRPTASLAIGLTNRLTWRGTWGYYGYDERSATGPTLPRDFNTTLGTVSLQYSF